MWKKIKKIFKHLFFAADVKRDLKVMGLLLYVLGRTPSSLGDVFRALKINKDEKISIIEEVFEHLNEKVGEELVDDYDVIKELKVILKSLKNKNNL